ncbi:MAG: hypothetical protein Q8P35_01000 [Candidatus Yanofskybacteria bacterium]|nr:hypothetical protein [Candidatus Yanofskybacteria bacterium]
MSHILEPLLESNPPEADRAKIWEPLAAIRGSPTPRMGATKIINILKDDTFEEIFGLFEHATADEVIFVLPKKSKAFSKEAHFASLAKIAKSSGKRISLLSSNAQAAAMGRAYDFEVMSNESASAPKKKPKAKAELVALRKTDIEEELEDVRDDRDAFERDVVVPSDEIVITNEEEEEKEEAKEEVEEEKEEPAETEKEKEPEEEELDELEEEKEEELAVVQSPNRYKVVPAAHQRAVRPVAPAIRHQPDPSNFPVSVNHNFKGEKELKEIEEVWREEVSAPGASIWTDPPPPPKKEKRGFIKGLFGPKLHTEAPRTVSASHDRKFPKRALIGLLSLSLIVFGAVVFISTGSAQISIKPTEKKLDFLLQMSASDTYAAVDSVFNKVPGQLFTVNRTVSRTFPASGRKEVAQKAKGKIVVYNEYGTASQTLIATTRFEAPTGQVFRTLRTVNVPGMVTEGGKVVPGQIEVEVIAERPGNEYNIAAAKFLVPAFRERGDSARLEKIYGRSTQPMTDGASGISQVVTELDLSTALEAVKGQLKEEIKKALEEETDGLIVPMAAEVNLTKSESSSQVDQAADEFTVNATGSVKTVGFKRADLDKLLEQYIDKNYNLFIIPDRIAIEFRDVAYDTARGAMDLQVAVNGNGYMKIDEQKILGELIGKPEDKIRDYLGSTIGISSARVVLSPFWVKKMPADKSKIKLEIAY